MSLTSWVINHVRKARRAKALLLSRVDLPPRDTAFEPELAPDAGPATARGTGAGADSRLPQARGAEPVLAPAPTLAGHLGAYAPLIGAVRQELEHFIVSQLRLHLAIADRDRFVLTSIAVHCPGGEAARERLARFMREFKPEQVKRYLAREVIAGLPNAAAIDLTQFAGLVDAQAEPGDDGEGGEDDYADLLAELAGPAAADGPAYEVNLVGRWSETDTPPAAGAAAAASPPRAAASLSAAPITPLAGLRCEFDVEDADGRRRIVLQAVVPGRRYVIGKGEGNDIVVRGTYTSRRHAELWLDGGRWWVADAGSTNGVRVDRPGAPAEAALRDSTDDALSPMPLAEGTRLVLSARSDGPPADCPWIALHGPAPAAARMTPIATGTPRTPLTAIRSGQAAAAALVIAAAPGGRPGGGPVLLALQRPRLPLGIGRSRRLALVIERRHDAVSGHHLDIVDFDDEGADIVVHGDNGVLLGGVHHCVGDRLRWTVGQALVLGAAAHDDSGCTLLLQRAAPR